VTSVINKPTETKPRGRPRGFDRNDVLAAAGMTFWRLGYEGASITDLTEAMGITPQSLYAAFKSKSALYQDVLDWYQAEVGAFTARALEKEPTAVAAFTRILRESAREFTRPGRPRGCMISTAILTCSSENKASAEQVAGLRGATLAAFRKRIDVGMSNGEWKRGTNARALARYLGAIIQGMSVQAQDGASKADLLGIAELAIGELARHQR
jgi:AcrR family transcriptional regulator